MPLSVRPVSQQLPVYFSAFKLHIVRANAWLFAKSSWANANKCERNTIFKTISGAIAGTAFNVASAKVQNNWVKAGVGAEGMIGNGKGSLMLNCTTSSGLLNAWLAASYQMNF